MRALWLADGDRRGVGGVSFDGRGIRKTWRGGVDAHLRGYSDSGLPQLLCEAGVALEVTVKLCEAGIYCQWLPTPPGLAYCGRVFITPLGTPFGCQVQLLCISQHVTQPRFDLHAACSGCASTSEVKGSTPSRLHVASANRKTVALLDHLTFTSLSSGCDGMHFPHQLAVAIS